jgi:AcrR family transcriptional regulator
VNQHQLETLRKNNEESRDFAKSCFRFALMIILKDKNDSRVTVSRLCRVAGVSRTAFYRNYDDVEDVLVDELKVFSMTLAGQIGTDIYKNWLALFTLTEEHYEDLRAVVRAGYGHKILEVFLTLLPNGGDNRTIQTLWLSLFHSMLISYVSEDKPKKPEEAARQAYKFTQNIPLVALER